MARTVASVWYSGSTALCLFLETGTGLGTGDGEEEGSHFTASSCFYGGQVRRSRLKGGLGVME